MGSRGGNGVLVSCCYYGMWMRGERNRAVLHMGNPVAMAGNSWTSLPELLGCLEIMEDVDVLGVHFKGGNCKAPSSRSGSFKLVALGEPVPGNLALAHEQGVNVNNPIPIVTYVYDSALGRWSATSSAWPGRLGSQRWMSVEGAFVDSILYHVVGREANLLVAYDLERDKLSWLEVDSTQARHGAFIVYCSLLTLRQRLLCVVFLALRDHSSSMGRDIDRDTIRESESDMQKRLEIWELDFARMTWMVVDTMPAPILTHFGRTCSFEFPDSEPVVTVKLFDRIRAVAPGGLDSEFQVFLINDHVDKVLAGDLHQTPADAAWRWLPSCPYKQFPNKYMYRLDPWLEFGSCKQV